MEEKKPITLAKVERGHLVVDNEALFQFVQQQKENGRERPFTIIPIIGVFRSGKSFMMNFFLRYLRNKGWENKDWLGDDSATIPDGFPSVRGTEPCTKGVTIWPEIFTVPLVDGRECSVYLADTQGAFDLDTSPEMNAKLMAFSTLLGSHQILNLKGKIDERDLEHLQLCIEVAKESSSSGNFGKSKPFQKLTFLVRDWELSDEFGESTDGYFKGLLTKQSNDPTVQQVKDSIRVAFDDIGCFLLPHPGMSLARGKALLKKDLDPEFLQHAANFVERVLGTENIVIKRTKQGEEETLTGLLNLLATAGNSFKSGNIPTPTTLLESFARGNNTKRLIEAVSIYRSEMEKECQEILTEAALKNIHNQSYNAALDHYLSFAKLGETSGIADFREQVKLECASSFESFKKRNNDRKVEKRLEFRQAVRRCEESYSANIAEIEMQEEMETFERMHRRFEQEALSKFDSITAAFKEIMPECTSFRETLEDLITSTYEHSKRIWELKKREKVMEDKEKSDLLIQKIVYKFRKRVDEGLEEGLDDVLSEFIEEYENEMAPSAYKNVEGLKEKLVEIKEEGLAKNREQSDERAKILGRRWAVEFEKSMEPTTAEASVTRVMIDRYTEEFKQDIMENEEYKRLPISGKKIVKKILDESGERLKKDNENNRNHRNIELTKWDKIEAALQTAKEIAKLVIPIVVAIIKAFG